MHYLCAFRIPVVSRRWLLFALTALVILNPRWAASEPVRAIPAHQVVNGIGVQTHFLWSNGLYRQRYSDIKPILGELGVRYIRDGLGHKASNLLYRDLWETYGIRLLAVADARRGQDHNRLPAPDVLPGMIKGAKSYIGADAIIGFEGLNELNLMEARFGDMRWPTLLHDYASRLNDIIRGDPLLRDLPILAPSMAQPANSYWYNRAGDYSDLADLGNGHIYGTFRSMSQKLDEVLPVVDRMAPERPVWATEFGWHTARNSGGLWVDEATKAKYLARAVLEIASRPQVQRGFIYELADHLDDPNERNRQAHFGLVDYNLNPKPSFYAVRNLMHLFCDNALESPPQTLDLTFEGETANLRSVLTQKNNGAFYLAVWVEAQSIRRNRPVYVQPQKVRIWFGERMKQVRVFRPADPTTDLATGREPWKKLVWTRVVTVNVADHPLVIELVQPKVDLPGPISGCQFTGT